MTKTATLWSSPVLKYERQSNALEKIGDCTSASLKLQLFLFFILMIEIGLNIVGRFIGLSKTNVYFYGLICKTALVINLLFIIIYSLQLVYTNAKLYLDSVKKKEIDKSVWKSVLFDLCPQLKVYNEKILCFYNKTFKKEQINTNKNGEITQRSKTLFRPNLGSINSRWIGENVSYNSGFLSGDLMNPTMLHMNNYATNPCQIQNPVQNELLLNNYVLMNNLSNSNYLDASTTSLGANRSDAYPSYMNSTPYNSFCKPIPADLSPIYSPSGHNSHLHALNESRYINTNELGGNVIINSSPTKLPRNAQTNSPLTTYRPSINKYSPLKSLNRSRDLSFNNHNNRKRFVEIEAGNIWEKLGINDESVDVYLLNLKQWLHTTIVNRIVDEINNVNKRLKELGIHEVVIGESCPQTLRSLANKPCNNLPTLSTLINFLDVSKDQGYVVNRLQELSQGLSLGKYKWLGGSTNCKHQWRDHLPNDATLILHLISTYIDSKYSNHTYLQPVTAFSQQLVVKNIDKFLYSATNNTNSNTEQFNCALYQIDVQPPYYKVICDNVLYNVAQGRRNLFECLLIFFYHVRNSDNSFKWLNLGRSGLNINWVFEKNE